MPGKYGIFDDGPKGNHQFFKKCTASQDASFFSVMDFSTAHSTKAHFDESVHADINGEVNDDLMD